MASVPPEAPIVGTDQVNTSSNGACVVRVGTRICAAVESGGSIVIAVDPGVEDGRPVAALPNDHPDRVFAFRYGSAVQGDVLGRLEGRGPVCAGRPHLVPPDDPAAEQLLAAARAGPRILHGDLRTVDDLGHRADLTRANLRGGGGWQTSDGNDSDERETT